MAEKNLSVWDHLDELRTTTIHIILVWIVFTVIFFCLMPYIFNSIILGPCNSNFISYEWFQKIGKLLDTDDSFFNNIEDIHLININLSAPFLIHLSTSFGLSFIVTLPFMIYEIWRFILPALYENERNKIKKALCLGGVMFVFGISIGYFIVFPLTLRFLNSYFLSDFINNQLSLDSYIDNFTMLILCMGAACELPFVCWLLSIMGIINKSFIKKYRKHAFVIIVIIAAIITPTGDPFTLFIVALPLYMLYELSIIIVKKAPQKTSPEQ